MLNEFLLVGASGGNQLALGNMLFVLLSFLVLLLLL